MPKHVKDPRST